MPYVFICYWQLKIYKIEKRRGFPPLSLIYKTSCTTSSDKAPTSSTSVSKNTENTSLCGWVLLYLEKI